MTTALREQSDVVEAQHRLARVSGEIRQVIKHMRALAQHVDATASALAKRAAIKIAVHARVKVVGTRGVARGVTGRSGIVLGRARGARGQWLYTVLIGSAQETYVLRSDDLEPTGEIASRSDIYSGASIHVRVG